MIRVRSSVKSEFVFSLWTKTMAAWSIYAFLVTAGVHPD